MILGKDFTWLHVPKTAGTELEHFLRQNFGEDTSIEFDVIDPNQAPIWHYSIYERKQIDSTFNPSGKSVIANIRRLPTWLFSRIYFEFDRSPNLVPTREMFRQGKFFNSEGMIRSADFVLQKYIGEVDQWIRVEHLQQDCESILGKYLDFSNIDIAGGLTSFRNETISSYIRDVAFYFTPDELDALYACNPVWCKLEQELYGDIVHL
jgi:hypothetical protein